MKAKTTARTASGELPTKATRASAADRGTRERARKAREARIASVSVRDIGELPKIAKAKRRAACARDFRKFCETYLALTFRLGWSPDHLKVIAKIERAVLEGGLFAMAMPRGSGKSSLCEAACVWALLYGHRRFVVLIGADEGLATQMLESIKAEIEGNDTIAADFPEVCEPIRRLDGITQRAAGQLSKGRPTHIRWTEKEIVLPTIAGSAASGGVVRVAGITGRIRGMKFKRPDGESVRPELVLVDDPQTDESAMSPSQCQARERILSGAVLGLAGPASKISGLMTLTIVREGDLADVMLDHEKHPQWQGERTKMVYEFPSNTTLWENYGRLLTEGFREGVGGEKATKFYRKHRREMDAGAVVAWEARYDPGELSAIQHAMNLRLRNEAAFFAEYQNQPMSERDAEAQPLTADRIATKLSGHARRVVPAGCTALTAFVDVQGKLLYWLVAAWEDNFTGYVIDYGSEPDQRTPYFTLRDARRTLQAACESGGLEASIYAGLERFGRDVLDRTWIRDDGVEMQIDRCLIDANWEQSTDVVYKFCRQAGWHGVAMPSRGRYVGASSLPMSEYKRKRGERVGMNWVIPAVAGKRSIRHVVYDTNFWKSFIVARLQTPMGDPGCVSLFDAKPEHHRLLGEHLTSEYRVRTQGRGRSVDEWKLNPGGPDNHWLDGVVGAAVAANMAGCTVDGTREVRRRDRGGGVGGLQRRSFATFAELATRGRGANA